MRFDVLTNAFPCLDVGMIYGVVRDAGLRASRGGAAGQKERGRMKVKARARSLSADIICCALPPPPPILPVGLIT